MPILTNWIDLSGVTWVQNKSFSENSSAGRPYSTVFAGNGDGARIASDLIDVPQMPISIQINPGFQIAVLGFDENSLYLGSAYNGYALPWSANVGSSAGLESFVIDVSTAKKIAIVLRRASGYRLLAKEVDDTGVNVSYETEIGGGGTMSNYTPERNLYAVSKQVNGYLQADARVIVNPSSVWNERTSDWIPVEGFESITIQAWTPSIPSNYQPWIGYAFYTDTDLSSRLGNRVAKYGTAGNTYLTYINVAIPETAKYIRVSYRMITDGYCKVEFGSTASDWRPAPEDATYYEGGYNFMILARNSVTVSIQKDVDAVYRYYKLQSSTAAVPAKPTSITTLPPSGWSDTEPTYTEGSTNSLYTVDLTIFTDGTFQYSEVSLSSSYEAAKQAYNKAYTAEQAASAAQTTANAKNAVFYQGTAPSASGRKLYDVWFNTADGNKMYYWNGSAWTLRQFGTNAIGESAITGSLIAGNVITGDHIVANTITGTHIAAATIKAANIDVSDLFSRNITATGTITGGKFKGAASNSYIESATYSYSSGNYAASGIHIDLSATGYIRAKNFAIDASGNAYFNGRIESTSGSIGGFDIDSYYLASSDGSMYIYSSTAGTHDYEDDVQFRLWKDRMYIVVANNALATLDLDVASRDNDDWYEGMINVRNTNDNGYVQLQGSGNIWATGTGYFGSDLTTGGDFFATAISANSNVYISTKNRGYFLKDSTDTSYGALFDNGSNLWIGATSSASTHHRGSTFISTGYNGTSGNETIYVSVPNAANNDATNYGVIHTNYASFAVNVTVTRKNAVPAVNVVNAVHDISMQSNTAGNAGIYDTTNSAWILRSDSSQNVYIPHALTVVSLTQTSDRKFKTGIEPATMCATDLIDQIKVRQFTWNIDNKHWNFGVIADEVYEVDSNIANRPTEESEGFWSVNDFYLTGMLIKAVQELSARIATLEKEV